jgi:hypothetical protein
MARVAIATCAEHAQLDEEGRLLLAALRRRGVDARAVVRDAAPATAGCAGYDVVVVRSTCPARRRARRARPAVPRRRRRRGGRNGARPPRRALSHAMRKGPLLALDRPPVHAGWAPETMSRCAPAADVVARLGAAAR